MAHDMGSLIREMRKGAGLSQMKLADKIGVSYQQVQKYEKGTSKLSVPRLMQVADAFGVPVTVFLDEERLGKETKTQVTGSNLTEDEAKMLMLFRRLPGKSFKNNFLGMLKDVVTMSKGK